MTTDDYAQPAATLSNGFMPLLGFGTWQISNRQAPQAIDHALQAGYRHIDTATAYHNESGIGKALASSTLARESVFVTTKLPPGHAGRERRTLHESLTKLGVDYVDLWLVSFSSEHDATTAQVIVAWHIAHGFVVIPKSSRRERIVANAAGARIELTAAEIAAIDGLSAAMVGSSRRFGRTSR